MLHGWNVDTSVYGVSRGVLDGVTTSNGVQSCRVWGRLCLYNIVMQWILRACIELVKGIQSRMTTDWKDQSPGLF